MSSQSLVSLVVFSGAYRQWCRIEANDEIRSQAAQLLGLFSFPDKNHKQMRLRAAAAAAAAKGYDLSVSVARVSLTISMYHRHVTDVCVP